MANDLRANDLRAATDAFFSVCLQRMVELSRAAAQVWSFNQTFSGGKNKLSGVKTNFVKSVDGFVTDRSAHWYCLADAACVSPAVAGQTARLSMILGVLRRCKKQDIFAH